jgi:hypothetical protein
LMPRPLFPELPEITEAVDNPTAEHYATAARYALSRGQLKLAVQQIAAAMTMEPEQRSHRQFLSEIVSRTPDPLKLLELKSDGVFYGVAAAHAWFLASKGRLTAALRVMRQVVVFRPNVPLLIWTEEWAARPEFSRKADPTAVAALVFDLLQALRDVGALEGGFRNLSAAETIASKVALSHPRHAGLQVARCRLLRESGEPERALHLALSCEKSCAILVEAALAHGELGHHEQQIELLRSAGEFPPRPPLTVVDFAKALLDSGLLAEAEQAFTAAAIAGADGDASIATGSAYLRWLREGTDDALAVVERDPSPLARQLLRDTRYYRTALPHPFDRTVEVIRDAVIRALHEAGTASVDVKVRVDGWGAPSAAVAFSSGLAAVGKRGRLTLIGERNPSRLGELWHMQDGGAIPLVPEALPDVVRVVEELARHAFSWSDWTSRARDASHCAVSELLSVAVRPPAVPRGVDAVEWSVRIHTAVGLLIAHQPTPWPERAAVIERALSATDDWICSVGIVASIAAAERDAVLVESTLEALARLLPRAGEPLPTYARTLAVLGSTLNAPGAEKFLALRARVAFS